MDNQDCNSCCGKCFGSCGAYKSNSKVYSQKKLHSNNEEEEEDQKYRLFKGY